MLRKTFGLTIAGFTATLLAGTAIAQEAPQSKEQIEQMRAQLIQLQRQVDALKGRVTHQEKNAAEVAASKFNKAKKKNNPEPIVIMGSNNRPGICTHDKFNCVYITGRFHLDAAAYNFDPASALTAPQNPHNNVNARRARIGLTGNFMRDWHWTLVGEFGGSQDGTAQLNNAFLQYRGFGNTWIEAGYMLVPYTLDTQVGSNNVLFMESATPQVLAIDLAAGDNRSAVGFRTFGKNYWFGSYITGPVVGADHTQRSSVGVTARAVFAPVRSDNFNWIVEGDYQNLITVPVNNTLRLRDRIEVRVDPGVRLLDTGTLNNVTGADVLSAGTAFGYNNLYFQGEYFHYRISRDVGGDVQFNGGYVQAAYTITGEARRYSESSGAFGGINPKKPFLLGSGGWGAWEVALRYSHADLNDMDTAAVVRGGVQRNITLGLNWYPTQNVRFMVNWIHGEVERYNAANVNLGAEYDVLATRMQIAF
ncbi:MAG TPA: porin [Xanthobacteraceae bacterium]|nr:porin [Xanthobacteraceae bacterium]